MNGLGILGALLGGFGGISQGMGAAEKVQLERARQQQEQDARTQQLLLDRDRLTQQQSQFDATKSWDREKFEAEQAASAKTREEAQAEKLLEYLGVAKAREAVANMGARAEQPMLAEGAMYSEADTLAGKAATPKNQILASLLDVKGGDALAKLLYPEKKEPTPGASYVEAVNQLQALEASLPKGHPDIATAAMRVNRLKPLAVQEGGFIGGPAGGPALIAGDRKPVSGETAQRVAGAEEARRAAQTLASLSTNAVTSGYLGPLDQYRETVQRMTPGAIAGEVPNEVVDMKQAMNTLNNYYINLISGAAVSAQEGERLKQQLPKMSSRPEVFQREVQTTLESIKRLEQRISSLALHGDPRARAVADQYGITPQAQAPESADAAGNGPARRPQLGEPGYTGVTNEVTRGSAPPGKVLLKGEDGSYSYWPANKPIPIGARRVD